MRSLAAIFLLTQGLWCMILCGIHDPLTSEIKIETGDLNKRTRSTRSSPGYCPDGWRPFGDYCYKEFGLSQNDAKTWNDSATHCQSIGANLASIHSEKEQGFLNSFAFDISTKIWIGLRRPRCRSSSYRSCRYTSFEWEDNSPTNYLNWRVMVYPYGERCGYMLYYHDVFGKWDETTCDTKLPYMCRKNKDPTLTKPGNDPSVCAEPADWLRVKDSCYEVFSGSQNALTWSEAESYCNGNASNLASVKNIGVTMHLSQKLEGLELFWIGVKSTENHEYTWLGREILFYTNWMSGQPTDVSEKENCVAVDNSGQWIVRDCSEKHPFICEAREGVPTIAPSHPNITCPKTSSKWNDFGGKYCYIIETTHEFTKTEASKLCCREGGSLASIHSTDEINTILQYTGHHGHLHIGFERDQNGDFVWDDGSTIDFVNWDSDEPNSRLQKCTEMHESGKWNDIGCTEKFGYVCSSLKVPETEDPVKVGYVNQLSSDKIALIIIICLLLGVVAAGLGYYHFYLSERRKQSDEVLVWNMTQ